MPLRAPEWLLPRLRLFGEGRGEADEPAGGPGQAGRQGGEQLKTSYPRISAGVMNFPEEIDTVLREIRALAGKSAAA